MKSNFKSACLLLTGVFICGKLFAQSADTTTTFRRDDYVKPFSGDEAFRTWSVGLDAGVMSINTILQTNNKLDFTSPAAEPGYGGFIKKQIFPSFGIQADFLAGKLGGNNAQPLASGVSPYKSFVTKINYAGSLSMNFTLANINWHYVNSGLQIYLIGGAGVMNYSPVLTLPDGTVQPFKKGGNVLNEMYVPVGAGIKVNVARGVNIEFGYQVNFVYSSNVDGNAHALSNSKFSYGHFGLEFALGKRSKPQLAANNPVSSMRLEYLRQNQNLKNDLQAQIDSEKIKNDDVQKQLAAANAILAKLTTDSDGDGVPDYFDKCPNTPAGTRVDASGCPLPVIKPVEVVTITDDDKKVVTEAIQNLQFDSGAAVISDVSYQSLEKLAKLLSSKKYHLKLAGYTDATGSAALNLKLSKERAEAIKMFLVSKGADPALIQTDGFGKANPIASNKTAAGRKLNRRVEFTLF
ncbi:MAG: OmpA family protein [Sphingobacteriales bacterium]